MSLTPGWGYPGDSRKAHYFGADDPMMSLCRKWGFFNGQRRDENHDSPENCAECKRLRAKATVSKLSGSDVKE